jgi:hypothetical protein
MEYGEIEEVFKAAHMPRTVEQLRAAVGIESAELIAGIKGDLDEATAVEQARDFYAEDISRWVSSRGDLEADMLLAQRHRYTQSWAFAQIIISRQDMEIEDIAIPEVDPDTLTRICIANAELGSLVADLMGRLHTPDLDQFDRHPSYYVFKELSEVLDHAKAPEMAMSGRRLRHVERLEALLEYMGEANTVTATWGDPNALLRKSVENIVWLVQNIHQAHHESGGDWRTCSQGTCNSVEHVLGQAGCDKNLNAIPVVP